MIEFKEVYYSYPNSIHATIKDVSFTAKDGFVTSIIGQSGAGKSTILNLILGIHEQDKGVIDIDTMTPKFIHDNKHIGYLGYVPQSNILIPTMSVIGNLKLYSRLRKVKFDKLKLSNFMNLLDLDSSFLNRKISQLSGGQLQRVSILRALMIDDLRALILDEPFSALDHNTAITTAYMLLNLSRELHIPIVIVTHNIKIALSTSDYIVHINDGRVINSGSVADVLDSLASQAGLTNIVDLPNIAPRAYALKLCNMMGNDTVTVRDKSNMIIGTVTSSNLNESLKHFPDSMIYLDQVQGFKPLEDSK